MLPLNMKLLRDLQRMKGQVLAIALVMASGVGVLIMSLTSVEALSETAVAYYERYKFAHVFATVKRAPEHLVERIEAIDSVQVVETRVVNAAILDIEGFDEPVVGQLVSVPETREPRLNRLALRSGRMPRLGEPDEALLSEPFAEAHGLLPGDRFRAVINGHWRELTVVGTALSPEYVYTLGPGALMPDDKRFGVVWLGHEALQAAFDLDQAFNDVSLLLLRGADTEQVIADLDRILDRYGGTGAIARADQISNWFLMNEIENLKSLASVLPTIFLAVAAFLTNMVLARLISVERAEIGLLKAFGYSNLEVGWHYVKLVLILCAVGMVIGWGLGYWLGRYNTELYADFYQFPFLLFRPSLKPFLVAGLVSTGAALFGTLSAVRRAAILAPAESMRPPAPPSFRRTGLARLRAAAQLDQPTRVVLRQIGRWPLRSFMTSAGTAMAVAVLVIALHWLDAIEHMVDVYFRQAQRQDVTVGLADTRGARAAGDVMALPAVMAVEPMRGIPVRMRRGEHTHRGSIQGLPARQALHLVFDSNGRQVTLPPDGLAMSTVLADKLDVSRGDTVTVEVLEGRRPVVEVPVADLFETYIGTPVYMDIRALNRLMREGPALNAVHVKIDPRFEAGFYRELKATPQVASVTIKHAAIDSFYDTMAETILIYVSFFTVFACTLAFGVTYNASRIALSERGRELATLRVLGFSKAEISYILLGETALLTVFALPLGCAVGYGLARLITSSFATELFRVPFVIEPATYGWAMLIGLAATVVSVIMVRRRLDRLDLIAVLKTRE